MRLVLAFSLLFLFLPLAARAMDEIPPPFGFRWNDLRDRVETVLKGAKAKIVSREKKENREVWNERGQDAMVVHLTRFFDTVRTRTSPVEDAAVGHRAAAVAHLINQSLREKKPLEWDFQRETARRSA